MVHLRSSGDYVGQQVLLLKGLCDSQSCRTRKGVPSIGGCMVSRAEDVELLLAQHGSDGDTPSKGFGGGENIRLHFKVLIPPHFASATHACLYLIYHHQSTGLIAQLPDALEELNVSRLDSSLTLEGLHEDGSKALAIASSLYGLHLFPEGS